MILVEETQLSQAALPLEEFKAHLRLGSGFSGAGLQDAVLDGFLRAALAAIEARTSKVLMSRDFSLTIEEWDSPKEQALRIAPVREVTDVAIRDAADGSTSVAPGQYRLIAQAQAPVLRPVGSMFPMVPSGGSVKITFAAGYSADWAGVPADLRQAVMLLAAHFYEYRNEITLGQGCMPFGVTSLIERYRVMRIGTGGRPDLGQAIEALVLETPQDVPDGAGGFDRLWMPLGTLWAQVSPNGAQITGGEAGPVSSNHYRIVVRGAPFTDPARPSAGQRFREGARVFHIEAVAERDPEGRYLTCFAAEERAP